MRITGLEPARGVPPEPKSGASANSAISAFKKESCPCRISRLGWYRCKRHLPLRRSAILPLLFGRHALFPAHRLIITSIKYYCHHSISGGIQCIYSIVLGQAFPHQKIQIIFSFMSRILLYYSLCQHDIFLWMTASINLIIRTL